jgi:alkylation response protein AidB-like acyl-CoA dehydrogenase
MFCKRSASSTLTLVNLISALGTGALRATLDYVTERKQFGKPISKYQLIQEKLAMMQGLAFLVLTDIY